MPSLHRPIRTCFTVAFLLAVANSALLGTAWAKPNAVKASYNPASRSLQVGFKTSDPEVVLYDDVLDQEIARGKGVQSFNLDRLPTVPCRVRVESGGKAVAKAVKGVECRGHSKPPACKITRPVGDQRIDNGGVLSFAGTIKGAKTRTLRYEWDFGGGADARSTAPQTGDIAFSLARDTRLWVTFTASDLTGARCADRIQLTVGNPPEAPAKVPEQAALQGDPNYVVMPFQPYGMAFHDLSYGYYSMLSPTNWVNAIVMQKARLPVVLEPKDADLYYSAASSSSDPAGPGSINSTSQNYPVGKPVAEAAIKKSDWFDPCMVWKDTNAATMDRNASDTQFETFFDTYVKQVSPALSRLREPRPGPGMSGDMTNAECAYSNFFYPNWDDTLAAFDPNNPASFAYTLLSPDAGAAYWDYDMISRYDPVRPGGEGFPGFRGVMQPKGSAMPGVGSAYQANMPQAFSGETQKESGDNYPGYDSALRFFSAKGLPQFPTDDGGRHNAYPIMRVQAKDKSGKLLGTTDAVTAVTTELKCAECHTKGKNGADQSIYDGLLTDMGWSFNKTDGFKEIPGAPVKAGLEKYKGREKWIPQFVAPEDLDAARKNERDVIEQASMINIARLHDFYYNFIDESGWLGPLEFESEQLYGKKGEVRVQPGNCTDYCHKSVPRADPRRYNMAPHYDAAEGAGGACPEMSDSLHNIHGRLLGKMNADYTGTIKRDPLNRELILADLSKAQDPAWPFFLKVADAGTPDDSCYFCHAGRQDKYQRDVMANAGVNCIDCHGDLAVLAGGGAMVSRDKSGNPLDSRGGPGDLSTPIDKEKLAFAYSAEEASYGDGADGNWHYLEKGPDGLYRHKGEIVTTLDMVLNFLSDTTGVDNGNGTFTLTTKSEGNPDVVATVTEAELLDKVKVDVNGWNLHFARIPWAEELSCANCHTGNGDEPVRRRAYDMTTGKFRLLPVTNERFAENMLPKKHDSSFTLEVQDGQNCPPGTFSDSVTPGGKHVCERGLFKDSLDRHGHMPCESCHGSTHAIWPNPNPYANDNVTAMQLQGHTGTILECTVCHTADAFKNESDLDGGQYSGDKKAGILGGPHNIHPVNDTYWWKSTNGSSKDGGYHNMWSKKPGKDGEDQCAACHGADHKGTRLSKTPVDRVLEMGKTKRFKKVTVKAGTAISCDLCHSIEQSFIK